MYTFEPAISFTRFTEIGTVQVGRAVPARRDRTSRPTQLSRKSVRTRLPLALPQMECYRQCIPMVAVFVHLCASMLQPRPSCQAVLCRRLAGSGVILCVRSPLIFLVASRLCRDIA